MGSEKPRRPRVRGKQDVPSATMLLGLSSEATLATVVGVLIEVPVMLLLVRICLRTAKWFGVEST